MTTKYFALTIGPIYETMKKASKTRSLWASSYMFSYLIRKIAERVRDEVKEEYYIMPVIGDSLKNGAGLYPDRVIAAIPESSSFDKLEAIAKNEILQFAKDIASHLVIDETGASDFINSYIRCICKEVELNKEDNIIIAIHDILDIEELKPKISITKEDTIFQFINKVNGSPGRENEKDGFLVKDGFGEKRKRLDSVLEVSVKTLYYTNKNVFDSIFSEYENYGDQVEDTVLDALIDYFKEYRPHQKYIAIVHADGDNIGKTIKLVGSDRENVKKISFFLHDFSLNATKEIIKYGGMPIYMGGDDMLFFAPVAVNEEDRFETIFNLCDTLDDLFEKKLNVLSEKVKLSFRKTEKIFIGDDSVPYVDCPTLSYGISVTFYKYPLYEALKTSHDKLWNHAKNTNIHPDKNTISLRLQKHSGQVIEADFEKQPGGLYKAISGLITKWTTKPELKEGFLNSVVTRLDFLSPLFEAAVEEKIPLNHFFDNHFNEDQHQKGPTKEFLKDIRNIAPLVFTRNAAANKSQLYTALRFIHFINTEKDDK